MGMMIHDGNGEEYVMEHEVLPYTLLEDDAPSKIDIQHVDRVTGTNPSSSNNPFAVRFRVRVLIAGFSVFVVAAAVVVISVRTFRSTTPEASTNVRFGSHHNSGKVRSILFHDVVRNAVAMVGRADEEFVKSSNEDVDPPPDPKNPLRFYMVRDAVRDANMVIGPGDHELIGSLDLNEEVSSNDEVLSSDDRHPEPEMLEDELQIYDDIVEFVYQSVISSAVSRQEGMNHEPITMAGHNNDEFVSTTMGSAHSEEDVSFQQSMGSNDRHPEPKSLSEDLEIYHDIGRDTRHVVGQGDSEYVPGSQRTESYDDSKESNVRPDSEPNTLAEKFALYHYDWS